MADEWTRLIERANTLLPKFDDPLAEWAADDFDFALKADWTDLLHMDFSGRPNTAHRCPPRLTARDIRKPSRTTATATATSLGGRERKAAAITPKPKTILKKTTPTYGKGSDSFSYGGGGGGGGDGRLVKRVHFAEAENDVRYFHQDDWDAGLSEALKKYTRRPVRKAVVKPKDPKAPKESKFELIVRFNPRNEKEFLAAGAALATKLAQFKDQPNYERCVKELIRKLTLDLSGPALRDVKTGVTELRAAKYPSEVNSSDFDDASDEDF